MFNINQNSQFASFTSESHGIKFRELKTNIGVSLPYIPNLNIVAQPAIHPTVALWDTGATNCAITPKVIAALGLKPIGKTKVSHADGDTDGVNVYLPNNIVIQNVKVSECKNEKDTFGVLIGMDIITLGDFSISNVNNETTFSFRIPSVKKVDFTKELPIPVKSGKQQRNDPCNCQSGKKYKDCCGKVA